MFFTPGASACPWLGDLSSPPAFSHAPRAQGTFGGWCPNCLFYDLLRSRPASSLMLKLFRSLRASYALIGHDLPNGKSATVAMIIFYKQFDTSTAMVVQKPNGLNSNRRSQNINKICFSHQVLLPALGWGTCRLPPHFHPHHVPRVRLADAARAASFTIFFEFGFLFFLRSTLDRIRLPQCGASVTTCFVAHAEAFPISARLIRTHRPRPA